MACRLVRSRGTLVWLDGPGEGAGELGRFGLPQRGDSNVRKARRLAAGFEDAALRIREHLDSELVLQASAEAVWRALGSGQTSLWLTTGSEVPVLACFRSADPDRAPEDAPPSVIDLARRRRLVVDRDAGDMAIPILAPRGGLLGALCVTGRRCDADELAFLKAIARETGFAMESANLYEKAIAEKEKSEAILARVGDGVIVTDSKGTLLQLNETASSILTCAPHEAVGRHCTAVIGLRNGERELDCSRGCALLKEIGETDAQLGIEVWRKRDDIGRQPLLANVSAVRDADGRVAEVVHSLRDITRLKEADEAKTLFLATASHELKTPLTVIQGFSQLLANSRCTTEAEKQAALEAISRRAIQLNKIVDRLLLSSRIEAGRMEISSKNVDLAPILSERVATLAATSGRQVLLDVDPNLPIALADPDGVTTVVDHLLDNAVKYSPDGGPISIETTFDESYVRLSVTDSGIGMDRDRMARCFEKFWQGESSDVRRFGGTGIGLFIVRSLVEAMGGEVSVISTPQSGSTFSASFRRAGTKTPSQLPHLEVETLAVADQSVIREFMRQIGIPTGRTS